MGAITYANDIYNNELYHYGIKGMRWGHRKPQSYINAKKARRKAFKEYDEATRGFNSFGIDGIKRANKAEQKYINADLKFASERVKYKTNKARNKEKAELKEYTKQLGKSGLPGSAYDRAAGGRSTKLYDQISREKGKKYADKVVKKLQRKQVAALVGSGVALLGAAFVSAVITDNT